MICFVICECPLIIEVNSKSRSWPATLVSSPLGHWRQHWNVFWLVERDHLAKTLGSDWFVLSNLREQAWNVFWLVHRDLETLILASDWLRVILQYLNASDWSWILPCWSSVASFGSHRILSIDNIPGINALSCCSYTYLHRHTETAFYMY